MKRFVMFTVGALVALLAGAPAYATTDPSAPPSASPSPSKTSVKPSKSVRPDGPTPSAPAGPTLPLTGPGAPMLIGAGTLVIALGAFAVIAVRRRNARFEA